MYKEIFSSSENCFSLKIKFVTQYALKKQKLKTKCFLWLWTENTSYLFVHMILAGPFFLGPLRCYFHGLGKKSNVTFLYIQPTEDASISQFQYKPALIFISITSTLLKGRTLRPLVTGQLSLRPHQKGCCQLKSNSKIKISSLRRSLALPSKE